jgi:hypothetical protein
MLDATGGFETAAYVGTAISLLLLGLALRNLAKVAAVAKDPAAHPLAKALAKFGDPESVADDIELELEADARPVKIGRVTLTRSWILHGAIFGVGVLRAEDVAWAFVVQHKTKSYFITVHTSYGIRIFGRDGTKIEAKASQGDAARAVAEVGRRAPWALIGYSGEVKKRWDKARAAFVAGVDARRAELEKKAAAATPVMPPVAPPAASVA